MFVRAKQWKVWAYWCLGQSFSKSNFLFVWYLRGNKKASETMLRGRHQRQKKRLKENLTLCYKTSFSILRYSLAVHSELGWEINNLWDNEAENIDFLLIMEQICTFPVLFIRLFMYTSSEIYIQRVHNSKTCMFGAFSALRCYPKRVRVQKQNIWGGRAFPSDW